MQGSLLSFELLGFRSWDSFMEEGKAAYQVGYDRTTNCRDKRSILRGLLTSVFRTAYVCLLRIIPAPFGNLLVPSNRWNR
jgi:hypothetical protein